MPVSPRSAARWLWRGFKRSWRMGSEGPDFDLIDRVADDIVAQEVAARRAAPSSAESPVRSGPAAPSPPKTP